MKRKHNQIRNHKTQWRHRITWKVRIDFTHMAKTAFHKWRKVYLVLFFLLFKLRIASFTEIFEQWIYFMEWIWMGRVLDCGPMLASHLRVLNFGSHLRVLDPTFPVCWSIFLYTLRHKKGWKLKNSKNIVP